MSFRLHSDTIHRLYLFILFSLALFVAGSHTEGDVTITVTDASSNYHVTKVALSCSNGASGTQMVSFSRRGDTVDRIVANQTSDTVYAIRFDLKPENEGYYFCTIGDTRSVNEVELVAYPTIAPEIRAQKIYSTAVGKQAMIHCEYIAGYLKDRHSVTWMKGTTRIEPDKSEFSRFSVLSNFSLVINDTVPDDASRAYACNVSVTIGGANVKRYAQTVSLEILDPIRLIESIRDIAIRPNNDAVFTCKAVGVPQPRIKWFISGVEVRGDENAVVPSSLNSITVQSSLILNRVSETQTGPVSCVAYHTVNGDDVSMATSGANLIVLTKNFSVTLTADTNGNVRIRATLPAVIPGVFTLWVVFIFNPLLASQQEIVDPSLKNTRTIDVVIERDDLPDLRQFGVRVALKFDDVQGEMSAESEKITLVDEPHPVITGSDCECPVFPDSTDSSAGASNTTISALLSVFIVLILFLVVVGMVLVGFCVHYMYKREPNRPVSAGPVYYHSEDAKDGSLSRSVSRSSYSSDGSRSSGRSSRSSGSRRSSKSGHSSHTGGSRTWSASSAGDLSSVKEDHQEAETESVKHKELTQWGGVEKEPVSSPDIAPAKNPYDEVEFKPPQSREEVFHTSLPHATNPIQFTIKYEKTKLRNSDSSFEGMELENSHDFSTGVPFRTT